MKVIRIVFRSGHVETLPIGDETVTWENRAGKLATLNVPSVLGMTGVFLDVDEVAAFFIYEEQ